MSELLENYEKFDIPIHSFMDVEDMSSAWNKTTSKVKGENASVSLGMINLVIQKGIVDVSYSTFKTVNTVFTTTQESIEAASAALFQQSQYPALKILDGNAEQLSDSQNESLDELKESIF